MRVEDVKLTMDCILLNRHDNMLTWVEDNVLSDGEIEYHFDTYFNNDFKCVLIRFCEDMTHTYIELYPSDFEDISELLYVALDEDTIEELSMRQERKNDY